MRKSVKI